MICCPRIMSIIYCLATLSIILNPVTGLGYAFDSASCSLDAIQYLNIQMRRATRISANTVTVLNQGGLHVPSAITDRIGNLMAVDDPVSYIKAVLNAGILAGSNGQSQQISGVASYNSLLPNFDSSQGVVEQGADLVQLSAPLSIKYSLPHMLIHLIARLL